MTRQLPLPFQHTPQFERLAFLSAPSNADARAWLDRDGVHSVIDVPNSATALAVVQPVP